MLLSVEFPASNAALSPAASEPAAPTHAPTDVTDAEDRRIARVTQSQIVLRG